MFKISRLATVLIASALISAPAFAAEKASHLPRSTASRSRNPFSMLSTPSKRPRVPLMVPTCRTP